MQGCVNALRYLARKANLDVTDNAGNNGRALAAGEEPPHQNVLHLLDELANSAGAAAVDAEAESDERSGSSSKNGREAEANSVAALKLAYKGLKGSLPRGSMANDPDWLRNKIAEMKQMAAKA